MQLIRHRYKWIIILTLLAVLLQNGYLMAAGEETQKLNLQYDEPQTRETASIAGLLLRLVLSLAFIIVMASIVIKVFGKQAARKVQGQWIQVLDEIILGQNRGVVLCEIGGKVYAIGVTDHQITTLFEVKDEALIENMIKLAPSASGRFSNFNEALTEKMMPPGYGVSLTTSISNFWQKAREYLPVRKTSKPQRHFHRLMQEEIHNLEKISRRQADAERSGKGD